MSKRRKVLVILGLIALAVVCFFTLRPRDEPKYQGRYLSEWMARYQLQYRRPISPQFVETQKAVRTIGTNGLPHFLKWMRYEPPVWRASLSGKLPSWIADDDTVDELLFGEARRRPHYGCLGVGILGTNAFVAMPELEAMMRDRTKPECARLARNALMYLGEPALPIFQAALADPNQKDRFAIVWAVGRMAIDGQTNACLPILLAALRDEDARVRREATNSIERIAPEALTNAPAP